MDFFVRPNYDAPVVPSISRNVRLPRDLETKLLDFCAGTKRAPSDVVREIVALFFAEGFQVAEHRLTGDFWSRPLKSLDSAAGPSDADRELAERIVTGRAKPRRQKKGA